MDLQMPEFLEVFVVMQSMSSTNGWILLSDRFDPSPAPSAFPHLMPFSPEVALFSAQPNQSLFF